MFQTTRGYHFQLGMELMTETFLGDPRHFFVIFTIDFVAIVFNSGKYIKAILTI